MLIVINAISIPVFIGIAYLFSNNKKQIQWRSVAIVLVLELLLAWFFTQFKAGQAAVQGAADGSYLLHQKGLLLRYLIG